MIKAGAKEVPGELVKYLKVGSKLWANPKVTVSAHEHLLKKANASQRNSDLSSADEE